MLRLLICFFFVLFAGCSSDESSAYRVAIDPSWYPQDFAGKEPALVAFSESLMKAIANKEDLNIEMFRAGPNFLEWGLNRGEWEGIMTTLSPAVNYEGRYLFSEPYLLTGPVIVVSHSSKVTSLSDLAGKTIGVLRGSSAVTILGSTVPNIVIVAYDLPAVGLEALVAGHYDALAMPILMAKSYVNDLYHGRLKIVTEPLNQEGLRFVTLAEDKTLRDAFDDGLKSLKHNGDYESLLTNWRLN